MAIKFVDVEPSAEKPKQAEAPPVTREPDVEALEQPVAPELPHPKPRGRKKPLRR